MICRWTVKSRWTTRRRGYNLAQAAEMVFDRGAGLTNSV
jgi:hypothetical protein